jgi:hypothetical protein
MRPCTTHHHACDCREAKHAADLAELIAAIGPVVEQLSDINDRMFYTRYRNPDELARYRQASLPLDQLCAAVAKVQGKESGQ